MILLVVAFAWLWSEHSGIGAGRRQWSFVRQLGTTSLVVYWVHIEIVYGRWLGLWHQTLTAGQCILAAMALVILMTGVSLLRSGWARLDGRMWPRKTTLPAVPAFSERELAESRRAAG